MAEIVEMTRVHLPKSAPSQERKSCPLDIPGSLLSQFPISPLVVMWEAWSVAGFEIELNETDNKGIAGHKGTGIGNTEAKIRQRCPVEWLVRYQRFACLRNCASNHVKRYSRWNRNIATQVLARLVAVAESLKGALQSLVDLTLVELDLARSLVISALIVVGSVNCNASFGLAVVRFVVGLYFLSTEVDVVAE